MKIDWVIVVELIILSIQAFITAKFFGVYNMLKVASNTFLVALIISSIVYAVKGK